MVWHNGHKPKRQRLIAVLDVGTSKITCLIARSEPAPDWLAERGQPTQLVVVGFGQHRSFGIKGGTIIDMNLAEESIRAAVDRAERMAQITIDEVVLSVSCGRIKSDSFSASAAISGDAVRTQDIDRVLAAGRDYAGRAEGRALLHALATGYRIDDHGGISDPRGMIGERLAVDIHAVLADGLPLKNLMLCVERCHLGVAGLVAAPYASGIATIVDDEARLGVTCIDMGAGTTSMAVFAEGQFLFADALAVGGNHITLDLARALSTPLAQAERIKTLHGAAFATPSDEGEVISFSSIGEDEKTHYNRISKAQVAEILRPRLEDLLLMIRDRLDASGLGALAGQRVVLTGGGCQLTGLPQLASRLLDKTVRLGRPRPLSGLPETGIAPSLSTAIGLLTLCERPRIEISRFAQSRMLGTGTGYIARVSQWIRDSF
jgi:cell division protein FtsA